MFAWFTAYPSRRLLVKPGSISGDRTSLEEREKSARFIEVERAIENVGSPRDSNPRHVATTSEQILELLDEVSAQYARG